MSGPKAIMIHSRNSAERKALDLLTYGSTIFPKSSSVLNLTNGRLIELGVEFAVAARRCLDVDGSKVTISATRFSYHLNDQFHQETDLWKALNGIIHARSLEVNFSDSPEIVFQDDGNSVALHFIYETDRYPKTYVDIFGMAWAFLTFGPFAWDLP